MSLGLCANVTWPLCHCHQASLPKSPLCVCHPFLRYFVLQENLFNYADRLPTLGLLLRRANQEGSQLRQHYVSKHAAFARKMQKSFDSFTTSEKKIASIKQITLRSLGDKSTIEQEAVDPPDTALDPPDVDPPPAKGSKKPLPAGPGGSGGKGAVADAAIAKEANGPDKADLHGAKKRDSQETRPPADRSDKQKQEGRFPRPVAWEVRHHRSWDFSRHESYRYLADTSFEALPGFAQLLLLDSGLTAKEWDKNELEYNNFRENKGYFRSKVEVDFTSLPNYKHAGNQPAEWVRVPTDMTYYHVWSVLFGFTEEKWQAGGGLIGWGKDYTHEPDSDDLSPLGTWQSDVVEGGTFYRVFVEMVDKHVQSGRKKMRRPVILQFGMDLSLELNINDGEDEAELPAATSEFDDWLCELTDHRNHILGLTTGLEESIRDALPASVADLAKIGKHSADSVRHDASLNLRQGIDRPDYKDRKRQGGASKFSEDSENEFQWLMYTGGHFAGKQAGGAQMRLPDDFVDDNFSTFLIDLKGQCLQTLCKLNPDKWLRIPVGAAREGTEDLPDLPLWQYGPCVPQASTGHNEPH